MIVPFEVLCMLCFVQDFWIVYAQNSKAYRLLDL